MWVLDIAQYTDQLNTYFADLPRVGLAYLFGSQARRKAGPLSDVDIAVLLVKVRRTLIPVSTCA